MSEVRRVRHHLSFGILFVLSSLDLEDGGVLVFTEVLLPCVFPRDAEHCFGLVVPHQPRVFPTADLQQPKTQRLSLI